MLGGARMVANGVSGAWCERAVASTELAGGQRWPYHRLVERITGTP